MRLHHDERGQTILLVALSLPFMLGFVGMATDVGALFKDKRTIQTAADAAAVAGALSLNNGAYVTAAKKASAANGFTDGSNGVIVTVNNPPTWSSSNYKGAANNGTQGYVEVTITKPESTIFLSLFGYPSVTVLARAVGANNAPAPNCAYVLANNYGGPALSISGTMQSLSPQCGLIDDSTNSPPMSVAGSLNMSTIGTVADCSSGCGSTITPAPIPNIIPYSDPLSYLPQFTCNGNISCTNGTDTFPCANNPDLTKPLAPGCYNGISATGSYGINLQPGTFVINGPLSLAGAGTLTGSGVTIIMTGGALSLNGVTLNLSAPTSGTYNGILFAQSSTDPSAAIFAQNASSTVHGFFYFPANQLLLNSTFTNAYTGFVAQSLSVTVSSPLSFNNYASLPGVTSPLSSAVLVE